MASRRFDLSSQLGHVSAAYTRLRTVPATREERNVRRMLAFSALFGVVNGGVLTFLPVFLVRLGASPVLTSLLSSLPALLTILTALPAGAIAARWRQPCRISARCFWGMRLLYLPLAAAGWLDPAIAPILIVIIWSLVAIPGALGDMVFYDVVAGAIHPRQRPAVNGARWALLGLVSAVSVAIFGQFLERVPFPYSYQAVFLTSMVVGMLSTACYRSLEIPEREPPPDRAPRIPWRTRLAKLLQPLTHSAQFRSYALVTAVLRLGLYLPAGLFSIFWVRELGASEAWVGWRATLNNIALTLGYYVWGRVVSRKGYLPALIAAGLGVGASLLLSATATPRTLSILLLAALISGFFVTGFDVGLFEWMLRIMPPGERPRYAAVNTALLNLIVFSAPLLGGAGAEWVGTRPILVAAGLCLLVGAGITCWWRERHMADN